MVLENKNIVLTGTNNTICKEIVTTLVENGASVSFIRTDIWNLIIDNKNNTDILINVLGGYVSEIGYSNSNVSYDEWLKQNLHNAYTVCSKIINQMISKRRGLVINFATRNCNFTDSIYSGKLCILNRINRITEQELEKHNITLITASPKTIRQARPYKPYKEITSPVHIAKELTNIVIKNSREFYLDEHRMAA